MKNILFFIIALLSIKNLAIAQNADAAQVKISLLTCAPGEDLYATFGHTAIRITDSVAHTDYVFNYGLFDFGEPGFYWKFTRGKLRYMLGRQTFREFIYEYRATGRSVWEQELNYTSLQKQKVSDFLYNNLKEENRYYKYDFIYDNCATRARDVLLQVLPEYKIEKPYLKNNTTARQLFHYYLDNGKHQAWSKLGIDMLLGSGTDTTLNDFSGMFLPEFLMNAFSVTTLNGHPIVGDTQVLFEGGNIKESNYFAPFFTMLGVSILFLILYYFQRKNTFLLAVMDSLLLFVTGLLGCLLVFMWLGTEHESMNNNFNVLWALPTNLIFAFIVQRTHRMAYYYWLLAIIINTVVLLLWNLLPQRFNFSLLPLVILMLYRYVYLYMRARRLRMTIKLQSS